MRRVQLSTLLAIATALAGLLYLVLPSDGVDLVLPVWGLLCAGGVLLVASRRREIAWWLAGGALLQSAIGEVLYYAYEHLWHTDPFPSAADLFYLSAYPLLGAAFGMLIRRDLGRGDRASLIDASIVVAGASALSLVLIVEPYVSTGGSLLDVGVGLAYPLGDLLILGFLTRLLLAPTSHPWQVRILAISTVGVLVSDIAFIAADLYGTYHTGPLDLGWIAWFGLTAVAAHLPAAVPAEGRQSTSGDLPPARLALLSLASLMAPAVLVVQGLQSNEVNQVGVGAVTATAFLLVMARMAGLVRQVQSHAASLTELSELDPLTGLANRRVWDRELPRAVEAARRAGRLLSVVMIDLDHFKLLNDAKGHAAGDQVLRSAAAAWSSHLRGDDLLARYGGEEFAVMLPGADESTSIEVVERLRAACPVPMTCSAGVAVLHPAESARELVERADQALYEAKQAGRNQARLSARPANDTAAFGPGAVKHAS